MRPEAFERLLTLIDSLPPDRKEGQRWRFVGLRGPVESALVRAADAPDDPETAVALLDAAVQALDRVDDNRTFREHGVAWRPLPLEWLPVLLGGDAPDIEARLALALASAFPVDLPFALYRFGIDWRSKAHDGRPHKDSPYVHPKTAPARWVWGPGTLARNLGVVLQRRLLDWEGEPGTGAPSVRRPIAVRRSDIGAWLDGNVDETLLARWVSRLALFDWSFVPASVRSLSVPASTRQQAVGPTLALYGLLHPLFDLRPVSVGSGGEKRELLLPETGARTSAAARRTAALIRGGDIAHAVEVARSRYAMANAPLIRTDAPWGVDDPERLLAALLFPVSSFDRAALLQRWLRPQRQATEVTHA
jgi:CRISPR-associated protein Csx17